MCVSVCACLSVIVLCWRASVFLSCQFSFVYCLVQCTSLFSGSDEQFSSFHLPSLCTSTAYTFVLFNTVYFHYGYSTSDLGSQSVRNDTSLKMANLKSNIIAMMTKFKQTDNGSMWADKWIWLTEITKCILYTAWVNHILNCLLNRNSAYKLTATHHSTGDYFMPSLEWRF